MVEQFTDSVVLALGTVSLFLWHVVSTLAGGPDSPAWRWALVEEGLFLALVLAGAYPIRRILGRKLERHMSQWGFSLATAAPFAALWTWYSFVLSDATRLGAHPLAMRDVVTFTWGLPMAAAVPFLTFGGLLLQVGIAILLATMIIVVIGHTWAG